MATVAGRRGRADEQGGGRARGRERKTKRERDFVAPATPWRVPFFGTGRCLLHVATLRTYGRTGWRFEDVDDDVGRPKRGGGAGGGCARAGAGEREGEGG